MKEKLTYGEIDALLSYLKKIGEIGTTLEFDTAIIKNIAMCEHIFKPIIKALDVPVLKNYETEINAINERYIERDENNNPITSTIKDKDGKDQVQMIISEKNVKSRYDDIMALNLKYKDAFEEKYQKEKDFQALLQKECDEFIPCMIPWKNYISAKEKAGEKFNPNTLVGIWCLIEEE
jgi:hypothetical protein